MNVSEFPFRQHIKAIIQSRLSSDVSLLGYYDEDLLLKNLSTISKFAFDQDFCDFGSKKIPGFYIQQNLKQEFKTSDTLLKEYNNDFFNNNGLNIFLQKYPLISALKKDVITQTSEFSAEIFKHILLDGERLKAIFNENKPLSKVKAIRINQGDAHQDGKSTAIVEFECGLKIVYKPRSGGMDTAFNLMLSHLSAETAIELKTPLILDRGDYFWMEFIEYRPVSSGKDLKDYYVRCGALLAISYLLGGTDLHHENIIAHGNYPVLIDLECLFGSSDEMTQGVYTVYNTGMVPLNMYEGDRVDPVDSSGLGAFGKQISGIEGWCWQDIDTDALRLEKVRGSFTAEVNQPRYKDEIITPEDYLHEVVFGFKKICKWFITHKNNFDKPGSVFANFKDKTFRIVIRNTIDYKSIIENSFTARALFSEEERKEEIYSSLNDFQPFIYLDAQVKSMVHDKEFEAIRKMNVPLFTGNTSKTWLFESAQLVTDNFFRMSPYQFVVHKIKQFTVKDLNSQVRLIESAFVTRYNLNRTVRRKAFSENESAVLNNSQLISETEQIALVIKKKAMKSGDAWIWNSYTSGNNHQLVYNTLGTGFYEGNLGIIYFLTLFDQMKESTGYASLCQAVIDAELKKYRSADYVMDISMSTGITGLIYNLVKLAGDQNLKKAIAITGLIKVEHISKDKRLDIMSGSAGLLQVLCLLYRQTKSTDVLKLMQVAGNHLLDNLVTDPLSGFLSWKTEFFHKPLTGFSHGVSGIACSLLSLFDCSGIQQYKNGFDEALRFENFYKDSAASNWRDLRENQMCFKSAWCHGAPGIGLARLHAFKILKDPLLLSDIEDAIDTTRKSLLTGIDFYCCGNTGKIDFLIEASGILNRPELLREARQALQHMISRKMASGFYQTYDIPDVSLENPSLFRGTAGIGYTLLRSIYGQKVSCVGLLE